MCNLPSPYKECEKCFCISVIILANRSNQLARLRELVLLRRHHDESITSSAVAANPTCSHPAAVRKNSRSLSEVYLHPTAIPAAAL